MSDVDIKFFVDFYWLCDACPIKLREFAYALVEHHQIKIDALQSELYIARTQNELYKSIVNESF